MKFLTLVSSLMWFLSGRETKQVRLEGGLREIPGEAKVIEDNM